MKESKGYDRYYEMLKDRAAGMTYEQIGKKHGITRQRVGQICGQYNKYNFRVIKDDGCIYKNLRKWMNDNSMSRAELLQKIGFNSVSSNSVVMNNFRKMLLGKRTMSEDVVGRLAVVTGMTYEAVLEVG